MSLLTNCSRPVTVRMCTNLDFLSTHTEVPAALQNHSCNNRTQANKHAVKYRQTVHTCTISTYCSMYVMLVSIGPISDCICAAKLFVSLHEQDIHYDINIQNSCLQVCSYTYKSMLHSYKSMFLHEYKMYSYS